MRIAYDDARGGFDLVRTRSGGLDAGVGNGGLLESGIWVSVFSDRRADPGDLPVELGPDRRGWWADSGKSEQESLGSLVWLYMREKRTETARLAIENAARESLQWLIDDGVANDVEVTATWIDAPRDALRLGIATFEPNGVRRDWTVDLLWSGIAG